MEDKAKKAKEKSDKSASRGAKDDWEAIKLILDDLPSLKQRVLFRIRELRKVPIDQRKAYSVKETREIALKEQQRKKNQG